MNTPSGLRTQFAVVEHLVATYEAVRANLPRWIAIRTAPTIILVLTFVGSPARAGAIHHLCSRLLTVAPGYSPKLNHYPVRVFTGKVVAQCLNSCLYETVLSAIQNDAGIILSSDYLSLRRMSATVESVLTQTYMPPRPGSYQDEGVLQPRYLSLSDAFADIRRIGGLVPDNAFVIPPDQRERLDGLARSEGSTIDGRVLGAIETLSQRLGRIISKNMAVLPASTASVIVKVFSDLELSPLLRGLSSSADARAFTDAMTSPLRITELLIHSRIHNTAAATSVTAAAAIIKAKLDAGQSVMFAYGMPMDSILGTSVLHLATSIGRNLAEYSLRERMRGSIVGHACTIEGYIPGINGRPEWYLIKDSAGTGSGDAGYVHMHRDFFEMHADRIAFFSRQP